MADVRWYGQYCKKIKGKLYYFGTDKKAALNRYLEQAAYLHVGKLPRPKIAGNTLSIKTLCNLYLVNVFDQRKVSFLCRFQYRPHIIIYHLGSKRHGHVLELHLKLRIPGGG